MGRRQRGRTRTSPARLGCSSKPVPGMRFLWLGRRSRPGHVTDPGAHAQSALASILIGPLAASSLHSDWPGTSPRAEQNCSRAPSQTPVGPCRLERRVVRWHRSDLPWPLGTSMTGTPGMTPRRSPAMSGKIVPCSTIAVKGKLRMENAIERPFFACTREPRAHRATSGSPHPSSPAGGLIYCPHFGGRSRFRVVTSLQASLAQGLGQYRWEPSLSHCGLQSRSSLHPCRWPPRPTGGSPQRNPPQIRIFVL